MRVGWGVDAHRFSASGQVLLAGVVADDTRGVAATSDGDVVAHALIDALLGAAALGDLGTFYPSHEEAWKGADSMSLLSDAVLRVTTSGGHVVSSVDVTVVAQSVTVAPIREEMRAAIAAALQIEVGAVSVKATTTDALGFTGRDEGLAALAVVVLDVSSPGGGGRT